MSHQANNICHAFLRNRGLYVGMLWAFHPQHAKANSHVILYTDLRVLDCISWIWIMKCRWKVSWGGAKDGKLPSWTVDKPACVLRIVRISRWCFPWIASKHLMSAASFANPWQTDKTTVWSLCATSSLLTGICWPSLFVQGRWVTGHLGFLAVTVEGYIQLACIWILFIELRCIDLQKK